MTRFDPNDSASFFNPLWFVTTPVSAARGPVAGAAVTPVSLDPMFA